MCELSPVHYYMASLLYYIVAFHRECGRKYSRGHVDNLEQKAAAYSILVLIHYYFTAFVPFVCLCSMQSFYLNKH